MTMYEENSLQFMRGDYSAPVMKLKFQQHSKGPRVEITGSLHVTGSTATSGSIHTGMIETNNWGVTSSYLANNVQGWGIEQGPVLGKPSQIIFFTPAMFAGAETKTSVRDYGGSINDVQTGAELIVSQFGVVTKQYCDYVIPKGWALTRGKVYGAGSAKWSIVENNIMTATTSSTPITLISIDTTPLAPPLNETALAADLTALNGGVAALQGKPGQYITIQFFPASSSDRLYGAAILIEPVN